MIRIGSWGSGGIDDCIFLFILVSVSSFFAFSFQVASTSTVHRQHLVSVILLQSSEEDYGDIEDDDEPTIKPYRNRSLSWTLRYRALNPYDKARQRVINNFGHRSKEDWDEAMSSGLLGQYVPNYPDEMYAPEWAGWDEWLGLMRPYNDTKNLASSILGLKTFDEYLIFVKSNPKRAVGLRIPVRPDIFYKDEWIDEGSFFGK